MGLLIDPPSASVSQQNTRSLLLPAGLLVAACVAALSFPTPYGHTLSWARLLGLIAEEVFTVSIVSAVTIAVLSPAVLHRNKPEFLPLVQRGSVTALWLAPFVLLLHERSPLTLPIAALLGVLITASLEKTHNPWDSDSDSLLISLAIDPIPLAPRFHLQKSAFAAMLFQIACLAALGGYTLAGAFLIAVCFAFWTWDYGRRMRSDLPAMSKSNPPLTLLLVSLLMFIGLIPHLQHGSSYGSTPAHRGLFPNRPSGGNSKLSRPYTAASVQGYPGGEGDQGIILWGEKRNYTTLVAPTPVVTDALNSNGNANPLIIPFDGVYWFFKSPDEQPPAGSRQAHTTPEIVDIHSTDRRPLLIEAHDHLANLIELNCCSRIQVAIRNADRYPETIALELVLVNTTLPHNPSVSLGRMMVNSTRPWKLYDKPATVDETLNFPIPPRRSLRAFDEVKIVFVLDRARADAAARIAIDHFVLVPRGL